MARTMGRGTPLANVLASSNAPRFDYPCERRSIPAIERYFALTQTTLSLSERPPSFCF